MSNLRQLENNLLLERAHEEPDERLKNISLKLYSAILQSKTTRDDNKVIKRLKESQLSQKISTFTIILDVHVLVFLGNTYRLILLIFILIAGHVAGFHFQPKCLAMIFLL